MDIDRILDKADEWAGSPMALATVLSTWGSAPRARGSHMLINADGRFEGSVSGGCVENDVLFLAEEVIASGQSQRRLYGVSDESAWAVGLPCGGQIEVLVQPVGEAGFPPALFEDVGAARGRGEAIAVTTDPDSGQSYVGEGSEGFVNHYTPPRRIIIVGAVQIAQPLAAIARTMDIAVTVVDPRGRFLTEERFPGVALDDRWPDDAVAALRPDRATAVVTLSHDIKIDDPALIAALRSDAGYIGALGSRRSHAARLERLAAEGFGTDTLLRIDGPAGIDLHGKGPAEIALSVAAAAVRALNISTDAV